VIRKNYLEERGKIRSSFENIFEAAQEGTVEDVKFFIEQKGVDVDVKCEVIDGHGGMTSFCFAVLSGNLEVAKYLISKGANINAKEASRGRTPLFICSVEGNVEAVKFLISKGADINIHDVKGNTPLHGVAADKENGAVTAEALISAGADIDAKEKDGWTPLHMTAAAGNIEVAKCLISAGANINEKNFKGETPFYVAKDCYKYDMMQYLKRMGGKKACYIATAVYGSYDCSQVWTLRRYRDCALANNIFGSIFISIYYAISPIMVKLFGKTGWFTRFCRNGLDKLVNRLQRRGYIDTPYSD
jgi:ankyrin repeat protein